MESAFDLLAGIVHSGTQESWKERHEKALAALFGSRYPKRAEKAVTLRAPAMKAGDVDVPYAAYIHPANADRGAYGGTSFVVFPVDGAPSLMAMCIGTQGLAPDEAILGRPGHARKMEAVCKWLNRQYGQGEPVAWAKHDPTRTDLDLPASIRQAWSAYEPIFRKYGRVLYAVYRPTDHRAGTIAALKAMLDILFEERGYEPLKEAQADCFAVRSAWFSHLMPTLGSEQVVDLLRSRRYVIIQGPPGTGKTRMARQILATQYSGCGESIQFHPNTTYESFVGGLAPIQEDSDGSGRLGFRFAPKSGFLMEAAAQAAANPDRPYLLHIDEINRADLGKVLGEAIFLLEAQPESPRKIALAHDFGPPFQRHFSLPDNLHLLGTMNSADRSIAILDVAVRRRFAFVSLWPSSKVIEDHGCELGLHAFQRIVAEFVEHASEDSLPLMPGHSYFLGNNEAQVRTNLKTNLIPLLEEYLAQGYVSGFAEPIRTQLQWLDSL